MTAARFTLGAATMLAALTVSAVPAAAAARAATPHVVRSSWTHVSGVVRSAGSGGGFGIGPALTLHRPASYGIAPALTIHR